VAKEYHDRGSRRHSGNSQNITLLDPICILLGQYRQRTELNELAARRHLTIILATESGVSFLLWRSHDHTIP